MDEEEGIQQDNCHHYSLKTSFNEASKFVFLVLIAQNYKKCGGG